MALSIAKCDAYHPRMVTMSLIFEQNSSVEAFSFLFCICNLQYILSLAGRFSVTFTSYSSFKLTNANNFNFYFKYATTESDVMMVFHFMYINLWHVLCVYSMYWQMFVYVHQDSFSWMFETIYEVGLAT